MKLAVPAETRPGERRVALVPDVAGKIASGGVEVVVEQGAGAAAHFPDSAYTEKGASVHAGAEVVSGAQLVAKVQPPTPDEVAVM
ncbi:MAG TPA: NAD(P)(+) transhydrogenase (Re/Si-specific) subunit alpha, partial [Acidimicrobiales bacterium]|nr:NAD(P)(+) transhydrogenase (Re/Si-specific) subunit alpha [Acidimicrobiales bacterium]